MKFGIFLLVLVFFCIGPVAGSTYYCNGTWYGCPPHTGMLFVKGDQADVKPQFYIDGVLTTPDEIPNEGPIRYYFYVPVGLHTLKLTNTGYQDLTIGSVIICSSKYTFVPFHMEKSVSGSKESQIPVTIPVTTKVTTTTTSSSGKGSGSFSGDLSGYVRQPTTAVPVATGTAATRQATQSVTPGTLGSERQPASPAGTTGAGASTGTLGVVTTPAGATIFVDGVQRAVSPASIPGLAPGDHTLLLRLEGYQDFTAPITIEAGNTQKYTTALVQSAAPVDTATLPVTTKKSPGFAFVLTLAGLGAVLYLRKGRAG